MGASHSGYGRNPERRVAILKKGAHSTSFSISLDTLNWLRVLAALDGRSVTATVERLVMDRALSVMRDDEAACRVVLAREGAG